MLFSSHHSREGNILWTNIVHFALFSSQWIFQGLDGWKWELQEAVTEFQRLSGVPVLQKWDDSVTHIIASTDENEACKRTFKILMGILKGKWVLSLKCKFYSYMIFFVLVLLLFFSFTFYDNNNTSSSLRKEIVYKKWCKTCLVEHEWDKLHLIRSFSSSMCRD